MESIRNHKEKVEQVLYEKDFYTESKNGKEYPKCKIKAEYISYEGEYLDKDEKYQKYEGEKVNITVYKLTLNEGNVEILKKSFTNKEGKAFSVNDKKEISLSVEEFQDLVTNVDLDLKKNKK